MIVTLFVDVKHEYETDSAVEDQRSIILDPPLDLQVDWRPKSKADELDDRSSLYWNDDAFLSASGGLGEDISHIAG